LLVRSLIIASLVLAACADEPSDLNPTPRGAPLEEEEVPPEGDPLSTSDFIYDAGGESVTVACSDGTCVTGSEPARSTTPPTDTTPKHSALVAAQLGSDGDEYNAALLDAVKATPTDEVATVNLWLWEPE